MKTHPDFLPESTPEHFHKACEECHAELSFWSNETLILQGMIRKVSAEIPGMESYARDLLNKTGWFLDILLHRLKEELTGHQSRLSQVPESPLADGEDRYWLDHREMMKKILVAFGKFRQMKKEMMHSLQYLLDHKPVQLAEKAPKENH